jgi:hypothetical protein
MKESGLMNDAFSWMRGSNVEHLRRPAGVDAQQHYKDNVEEEDPPTQPLKSDLPLIEPAKMEDLVGVGPDIPMEQPLMDELRALRFVYALLRGLSHQGRARVLQIVVLWLGEMSPDPRDKELARKVGEPLVPVGDEDAGEDQQPA